MKVLIFTSFLVMAFSASLDDELLEQFQNFKLKFNKSYKTKFEEAQRLTVFKNNLCSIKKHNNLYEQGMVTYRKGINKFSDFTKAEFKEFLGSFSYTKPEFNSTTYVKSGLVVPDSVDWRSQNLVTNVKDQGDCGSCWAFSVTGSIEAAYSRKSGNLVSLSEQQLIDCTSYINYGCNGGYLDLTYPYIQEYGLESEDDYGYTGYTGNCLYDASKVVTKIDGYFSLNGENDMLEAVGTIGPVSVTMDASYLSSYAGGIYSSSQCTTSGINHAVLIVGYGNENGVNFWIVKNSWGDKWGESGYFRLLRGVNMCGVAVDDVYPYIN